MRRTPLNAVHKELGARMVEFAGWEMPVQYESALKEHLGVRQSVGLFDVSHMGEIEISGPDAPALVQWVTCNDTERLSQGQAQYNAFLTPDGTVIDDVVLYRLEKDTFLFCVNAANREKDFNWLFTHKRGEVLITDRSDEFAQIALQGPRALDVLRQLTSEDPGSLKSYWFRWLRLDGFEALVSRTGYTGEDGFEIYLPPEHAENVWRRLLEAGKPMQIVTAGLAARNTLRLEMRYALYGNDIDESTTPLEAGLSWIVKFDKGDFIGRPALLRQKEQGLRRKLVGFEMVDRAIPRDHFPTYVEGQPAEEVRSGSFSPSLQKGIGLVYLPVEASQAGTEFEIEVRGKRSRARVVKTPFYEPRRAST